jgi:hypothetical protein
MDMSGAKQGEHVRVFQQRQGMPRASDQWSVGYVKRVGPALLYVAFDAGHGERTLEFRRASGAANSDAHYGYFYVMTCEEAADREERFEAEGILRKVGLQFTSTGRRDLMPLPMLRAITDEIEGGYEEYHQLERRAS